MNTKTITCSMVKLFSGQIFAGTCVSKQALLIYVSVKIDACKIFQIMNTRLYTSSVLIYIGSRVRSGSIVSDYGLDDRAIGVRSPAGAKDFSSSLCVQTGSGAHTASCTLGTGGPFPGSKSAAGA
jgi:hypothetical protein